MDVLLLCGPDQRVASTVEDQLNAIEQYSRNQYFRLPVKGNIVADIALDRFDALVIHYTIIASDDRDLSPHSRSRIREFVGLKAMFIQDEYRFVNRTISAMQEMDIDVLFTCVPEAEIEKVYPNNTLPRIRKVNVLTGYVPEYLLHQNVPSFDEREIDVGYRGRTVPAWLGELGQEKWRIGHRFGQDAKAYGLTCDIAYREENRLYGKAWIHFLSNCKAVLGVESGSGVFDFSGEIQRQVEEHELRYPGTSFEELRERYFKDQEGRIALNQISPRSFECAALRTVMILYEGEYSGILKPWRHYLPLKKDHSNMAEIVSAVRDSCLCQEIIENTYREVAENSLYSFKSFVDKVDKAMSRAFRPEMARKGASLSAEAFSTVQNRQQRAVLRYQILVRLHLFLYMAIFRVLLFWASPLMKHRIHLHLRQYYRAGRQGAASWLRKLVGAARV